MHALLGVPDRIQNYSTANTDRPTVRYGLEEFCPFFAEMLLCVCGLGVSFLCARRTLLEQLLENDRRTREQERWTTIRRGAHIRTHTDTHTHRQEHNTLYRSPSLIR